LKKEQQFEELEILFPNYIDYASAKREMSQIRVKLETLGTEYVDGKLSKEEFKQQVHETIHNKEARDVLDHHRSPLIAEFVAFLKNILSILALFIPIIINKGFFSKAPTNSSEILDTFDNKISALAL
jgi:hypothetical protein